jgi:peptidase M1-like protein
VQSVLLKGPCILCLALCLAERGALAVETATSVAVELHQLSIDPTQTYRVRELEIARGDIKIYLTEGILAFAKPVAGKTIAAVFTTSHTEAGDAEILVLPPTRSERAALASFTKTPNLDEHLQSAVFFFADDTAKELQSQLQDKPLHPAPDEAKELAETANHVLQLDSDQIDVKLARALLDNHPAAHGFFYGIMGGRTLGIFDVVYEPTRFEPIAIGRVTALEEGARSFQVWCSFRPRRSAPPAVSNSSITDYLLDTVFHPDLSMSSQARFQYHASSEDGRVIGLELSSRLRLTSARIDGQPAEVFQHPQDAQQPLREGGAILLVAAAPLSPEGTHDVEVSYEGSVVRRTASGNYFVDERNTWYPFLPPMLTTFDLTFHCPQNLRVVSTGELVSDDVSGGVRTVHRKTRVAEPLAGFNLGDYDASTLERGPYRIEVFGNKLEHAANSPAELPAQAAGILDNFTTRWLPLNIRSLAISPIEGYFGQGFPGLIYLSSVSYVREEDRPAQLRNVQLDSFFSEMLLPHEIAHQWWGCSVSQADYRTAWLFEAMSNYAALEFLEETKGRTALDAVLARYRNDLLATDRGKAIESAGPVDFGERLLDNNGMVAWHHIIYEKGAWILHMLRMRLGDEAFHTLQTRLLTDFQGKLLSNEEFRKAAAGLLPAEQSDKSLNTFFENWIYSTGIPRMKFHSAGNNVSLNISGVDEGFALDLPLRCSNANGKEQVQWVHAGTGDNSYEMPEGSKACQLPKQTDYLYQLLN